MWDDPREFKVRSFKGCRANTPQQTVTDLPAPNGPILSAQRGAFKRNYIRTVGPGRV